MKRFLSTSLLAFIFASVAWSQDAGSSQAGQGDTGGPTDAQTTAETAGSHSGRLEKDASRPTSANSNASWLPSSINGETGRLAFLSEIGNVNLISGGLTFCSSYDDNALAVAGRRAGNSEFAVLPSITVQETRPRTVWTFSYSPGFTRNQRLTSGDQTAHNLDFDFQYRFTERFTARVRDRFSDTTTSHDRIYENPLASGGNILIQPNNSVVTPLARSTMDLADLGLVYQVGELTMIGASGGLASRNFSDATNLGRTFVNGQFGLGSIFFEKRVSRRNTLGTTFSFQKIASLGEIRDHVTARSLLMFYTVDLNTRMTISVFAGPDYSKINDQYKLTFGPLLVPISHTRNKLWIDEGATFEWQAERMSVSANFIHHISDGGGLTGGVRLYSAIAAVRYQLTRRWSADLSAGYGNNEPLSTAYGSGISATMASVGLERVIWNNVSVSVRYGRSHQEQNIPSHLSPIYPNHNQGWVSLSYTFSHPLGR